MRNRQLGDITLIVIAVIIALGALGGACIAGIKYERIEPGYVGVSVTKCSGGGVAQTPIPSGIYWRKLFCEDVVEYPISMQNLILQGADGIVVNSSEGLAVEIDIALNFTLESAKVPTIYSKWRSNIEDISHKYVRQTIREGLQLTFAKYTAEELYSTKKEIGRAEVEKYVVGKLAPEGFLVSQFTVNRIQPPPAVIEAINQKVAMIQQAQRSEQEVRKKQAEAAQKVAEAKGLADSVKVAAEGEAESIRMRAEAQAKANKVLMESLTPALIEYEKMRKWDGKLPQFTGGGTPLIQMPVR
jgi:regulator of protease activity HflC (stomatin/prohibitin superfamily)